MKQYWGCFLVIAICVGFWGTLTSFMYVTGNFFISTVAAFGVLGAAGMVFYSVINKKAK